MTTPMLTTGGSPGPLSAQGPHRSARAARLPELLEQAGSAGLPGPLMRSAPGSSPLRVRGGAGSILVQVADLDRAANRLRGLGAELAGCSRTGFQALHQLQTAGGQILDPRGFLVTELAMLAALAGPGGIAPLGSSLGLLAQLLSTAAAGYRSAESAASGLVRGAELATGRAAGAVVLLGLPPMVPLLALAAAANWSAARFERLTGAGLPGLRGQSLSGAGAALLHELEQNGPLTEQLITVLTGAAGVFDLPGPVNGAELAGRILLAAGLIGRLTGGQSWLADPGRAVVSARGPGSPVRPAAGVAGLIRGVPPSSRRDQVVRVERVDGPAGRHWVVAVPGTDSWPLIPQRSPFDASGAVGSAALRRTAGLAAVEQAMSVAGVQPGEPVLLTGHSQGGMLAAAVAADPAIQRRFTITHVVTAGSPIAGVPVPGHVRVLSIEHDDDLVPHLDGASNPDQENWTTVSTRALPPGPHEPLAAHDQNRYAATATRIDASQDASVRDWIASADGFLDGPGTSATSWTIHVRRAEGRSS